MSWTRASFREPVWLLIAGLTAVAVGLAAVMWAEWVALALPFLTVLGGTLILQRRMRLGVLSPIAVLIFSYLVIAISGPLVADAVVAGNGVSARISLPREAERGAYFVFVVAAAATLVGAWLYSTIRPVLIQPTLEARPSQSSRRVRLLAGIFSVIPLGLMAAAYGPGLLYRLQYIPTGDGDPLASAANTLALPVIAVLGWLTQASATRAGKFLSWIGLLLYAMVLFSRATRALALLPPLLALGIIGADPTVKGRRAILLGAAASAIVLLQVPLALRSFTFHGLLPYLQDLPRAVSAFNIGDSISNVLFAFQLTGYVGFVAPPLSIDTLLVSLDPRPGTLAGWYNIDSALRVNLYTPYNSLGELANHGWVALVSFFLVTGAYFAHLEGRIKWLLSQRQGLAGLLLFALTCLFLATTLQYNLRSSVRILYYLAAFEIAISFALRMARHKSDGQRVRMTNVTRTNPATRNAASPAPVVMAAAIQHPSTQQPS